MFKLICVTNRRLCQEDFSLRLAKIAAAGPDAIILREKDLPAAAYQRLAQFCAAGFGAGRTAPAPAFAAAGPVG